MDQKPTRNLTQRINTTPTSIEDRRVSVLINLQETRTGIWRVWFRMYTKHVGGDGIIYKINNIGYV